MTGPEGEPKEGSRGRDHDPDRKASSDPASPDDDGIDEGTVGTVGTVGNEDGDEKEGEADPAEEDLPPNRYLVLASRPCQAVDEEEGFEVEREEETGLVTLIHPKRFGRVERRVHRWLGGPRNLRRPLDVYGSRIWDLCDGERSLAQIIEVMESEFHEAIHPAASRIQMMLELMVRLGFVKLLPPDPEILRRLSKEAHEQDDEGEGTQEISEPSEPSEPSDTTMEGEIGTPDREYLKDESDHPQRERNG